MADDVKQTPEAVKVEMEKFLNNPSDIAEWEYYEKTMGERMILSGVDQKLADAGAVLSDETYRQVLDIIHQEKTVFDFTSNLSGKKKHRPELCLFFKGKPAKPLQRPATPQCRHQDPG